MADIVTRASKGSTLSHAEVDSNFVNLNTFTQSGTGATAREVTDKLKDVVSVKDFGAAGDGTTNDAAAISNAIQAAANKILLFPAGTYLISSTITASTSNVTIMGSGPRSSVIKRAPNLALDVGQIRIQQCQNVYIADMGFDGNKANQTNGCSGLVFASTSGGVSSCSAHRCEAWDWGESTNTAFAAGISGYGSSEIVISECKSINNGHYGFTFFECENIQITSCFSSINGRHGYGAAGIFRFVLSGNIAEDNPSTGIWYRNIEEGIISNNIVRWSSAGSAQRNGILVKRSTVSGEEAGNNLAQRVEVSGNIVINCRDTATTPGTSKAIYVQANSGTADQINVCNNMVADSDYGIYTPSGQWSTYIGNSLYECRNIAVYDDGSNHVTYHDNLIVNGRKTGMYLRCRYGSVKNNVIKSNALDATTHYGINYKDRTNTTIADNTIDSIGGTNSFANGIYLEGDFVTDCKVYNNHFKSSNTCLAQSGTFGTSGAGNATWNNFNTGGFLPYSAVNYTPLVYLGTSQSFASVRTGSGSPEGVETARPGSLFLRSDGGAGTSLYVKESGTGNTGWVAK